ncbi:MAG: hypothetical protein FWC79_03115 [Oscillospiraceae bacterium]|nr:hypothetical protein [Oscillospiraceae bacterium]
MGKQIVKLMNNYFFVVTDSESPERVEGINIEKISRKTIAKSEKLILKIDFNNMKNSDYKNILKKLFTVKKKMSRKKITFGIKGQENILLGYLINYDKNDQKHIDFIHGINAIFHSTLYDMYSYIYDVVCGYLDYQFAANDLCGFKDDKCVCDKKMGCCAGFKKCKYLGDEFCSIKCISCKLFTCPHLWSEGVRFYIKDILLLETFFNEVQKYLILVSVFLPKDIIMMRILPVPWNIKI